MGTEAIEILKTLDFRDLTTQLVMQCAPLISGLKFSNLLSLQSDKMEELERIIEDTDICAYYLTGTDRRIYILLYNEEELKAYIAHPEIKAFLQKLSYSSFELEDILKEFKIRYSTYMLTKKNFPHEMGVILGYPIEDVVGFIDNNGENFLYSGYWKVYENVKEKKKIFTKYEMVREAMIHLISKGIRINEIIQFKEEKLWRIFM